MKPVTNPKVQGIEKRKAEADPRAEAGPRSAASPGELDWGLRCDCGKRRAQKTSLGGREAVQSIVGGAGRQICPGPARGIISSLHGVLGH